MAVGSDDVHRMVCVYFYSLQAKCRHVRGVSTTRAIEVVWWAIPGAEFMYCSGHLTLEAKACALTMSSMIGFNCTDDACAQASQGFCNLGPLVCLNRTRILYYFSYGFGVLHVAVIARCLLSLSGLCSVGAVLPRDGLRGHALSFRCLAFNSLPRATRSMEEV